MPVSIGDVAEKANVSSSTVSRILNADVNTKYSRDTQERVRRVAREMGYRPNAVARSLRTQRTDVIGFYGGYGHLDAREVFISHVIAGLQDGCDMLGKDLLLHRKLHLRGPEGVYGELVNGRIDGLVLFTPPHDRLVGLLADSSLPAVVVADAVPSLPSIVVDDTAAARLIARHLAEKGHSRILYRKYYPTSGVALQRRLTTFREAAAEYGMTVHEVLDVPNNPEGAAEEMALLTSDRAHRPTAAVCWQDASAYRLVKLCGEIGLRVPEDLAVVGFNGIDSEMVPIRTLTTVRAPWEEVGKLAVRQVLDMLEERQVPRETVLPVELVIGETT